MSRKKISTKVLLSVCALLFIGLAGFVKADDPIQRILAALEKWSTDHPIEKVYIQTDKPYYALGDDIWMKAYITIGGDHRLSAYSGALNVELIDDAQKVKQWIKLPVINGTAEGDFAIADTLRDGNYHIRAYTNWMRNAGEEYFFDKAVVIGSTDNMVLTKTAYNFATVNNQQKITGIISYNDLTGKPYAGNEVTYEVQMDNKSMAKGKGITDSKGNLAINFTNSKPAQYNSGSITTKIKLTPTKTITKIVSFNTQASGTDVQFFPESGNLVNGVRSRMGFKAVNASGLGTDVKGVVVDNTGTEVSKFETQHLGMGIIPIRPEAGKTYQARVTFSDGSQKTFDLPKALDQGYVLSVNNSDDANMFIRISASANLVGTTEIYLVAQAGGVVCYAGKNSVTTASLSSSIPKSRFPTGVVQFTLFSASGEPLCERVSFVNRNDQLKLNVSAGNATSAPREKVKISLNAVNKDNKPAIGVFSASVIDDSKVPTDENTESTILSNLLLTSDIKGYVEQPNYYFNNPTEQTNADLDALMLTQGYRRFDWKQVIAGTSATLLFKPEQFLTISGTIKTDSGKPVVGGRVTVLSTKGGSFILDTLTDAQGKFAFKGLIFKDSVKFVVQARDAKKRPYVQIELDRMGSHVITKRNSSSEIELNAANMTAYLQNSKTLHDSERLLGIGNHPIVLKEVNITAKKDNSTDYSNNLNGSGHADQVIKGEDLSTCPTIDICLQGRLLGVRFVNGVPYSTRSPNTPMLIVIDGIQSLDENYLSTLNPMDVASVEVLRSSAYLSIYGGRGGGGVLIINTKRGLDPNYVSLTPAVGISSYLPKGYYVARTFYAPKYDDPKINVQLADLRTTIAWHPRITTDKDGNASFEFFNAGSKATYRVVVEGIDGDGNLGRQVYKYKVQ
jgi:hypothetical protein